jgi:hypothetical protein
VLPDPGEVDEAKVDDLDPVVLEKAKDVRRRRRWLKLHGTEILL